MENMAPASPQTFQSWLHLAFKKLYYHIIKQDNEILILILASSSGMLMLSRWDIDSKNQDLFPI